MMPPKRTPTILLLVAIVLPVTLALSVVADETDVLKLETELAVVEALFAETMANRDLNAFASFLDDETVFFTHDSRLHGKQAVTDAWSRFFEGAEAPFSWKPEAVAVLESGELGFSTGPVIDPEGNRIGTFNSVWRRGADGSWKIIFDRGCP